MFKESETIELRKSLFELNEGIISLSSMLNKNHHGELFFGILDDGKIVGLDISKKTIADVTHEIQNHLKPLPSKVHIDEINEDGKQVMRVVVEGNDTPYSAYGRYYIRINDADISMNANQLRDFFFNKEDTYARWEQIETVYGVDDIDENLLIDCVRVANDKGRLNYVYRNAAEALQKLGLLTSNNKLNNAGWYLFGNNKPLKIKEANYPTDTRGEFGEIKEFRGNIFECINENISYIQNHISYKATIEGIQRVETPEIPLKAIREIINNSYAHCNYSIEGDFNQCVIYKSSIRIYNPGNIINNIDPLRFASGKVGSKIRNILISDVLYIYGYIDAFGTGFDRTFTLCKASNVDYEYYNDEFGFTFIFKRNPNFISEAPIEDINPRANELEKMILEYIRDNRYITIPELSSKTKKSEPTIHRHLDKLVKKNLLERRGSRKTGYWNIKN